MKRKSGKKMSRKQKRFLFGAAVAALGLGFFLWTRKASAGKPKVYIPPQANGKPAPELEKAPTPVVVGIPVEGKPLSELMTGPDDPLKKGGWMWEYIGAVDPSEGVYSIGEKLAPSDLPFLTSDVTAITPLNQVLYAYLVGPGEMLVQGYYLVGPMKEGYGFQQGAWGIVEVWNPTWHGH